MTIKSKKVAVKKVAKKATVKKVATTVAKKVAKKPSTKKILVTAKNEHSFWTKNGQIFNTLKALQLGLEKMDKAIYAHHVTKDRNDFALWVDAVLNDKDCATELSKAKTASSAAKVVAKHLKTYQA